MTAADNPMTAADNPGASVAPIGGGASVLANDPSLVAMLQEINRKAAFNQWAGFDVCRAAPGQADLSIRWRDELGQYSGYLHAGLIGALLDTACGFAAVTQVGRVMASHFAVNCLAPSVGQRFVACGQVVKAGRRQVFTRAELFAEDGQGGPRKLVATGEAVLVPVAG